jgi:iron complex transport system substrate-binding protein
MLCLIAFVATNAIAQGSPKGSASAAVAFTDARGVAVSMPAKARRVVSLSPAITEILFAAGAGNSVVGVTTYCNFPAAASSIARIGGFSASTVSVETILSLGPDLVLGDLAAHGQLAVEFERAGLRFAALESTDFQSVYAALDLVGRIAGDSGAASALVASMKARVEAVRARTPAIATGKRPLVFWETWDEPLMSAGPGTFIGQIIEAAGGRNCFADSKADWPVVGFESLLARDPDWIMSSESHGDAVTLERLARRPGWSSLKAVRTRQVALFDADIVSRAGPRFVEALELMSRRLYPEQYRQP